MFLIAAALFGYLIVALILGIPDEQRAPTVIVCAYGAAVAAGTALGAFDARHLYFVKMTPVTFGRLTVSMLGSHCAGYLVAAAIVGVLGVLSGNARRRPAHPAVAGGVRGAGDVADLVSVSLRRADRRGDLHGLVMGGGLILALAAASLEGAAWPAAYAGFVVVIPWILYGGASRRYQDATIEDWAAA